VFRAFSGHLGDFFWGILEARKQDLNGFDQFF